MQDKKIIAVSLILIALGTGAYFYSAKGNGGSVSASQMEAIKTKAEKFINEQLVQPGTNAAVKSIVEENGMYKILVGVGAQEIAAYISKDGKNFYPQVYNIDEQKTEQTSPSASANPAQNANRDIAKTDKPDVELFVMSYCPYGLQIEKGILPVVELLESKINFQLKFVDYAMHGQKEIDENLRQYCIQKKGLDKLDAYLSCFVKQGDSNFCLSAAKVDVASCVGQTDAQFKINAKAADKSQWRNSSFPPFDINQADNARYGVQGSPALVINGKMVQPNRNPQSLLDAVCSAFTNKPGECDEKLSSVEPAPGFGTGVSSGVSAQCGT
ncbi:MAG: hypothetical protein PHT44_02330 [Candidatus Portnoybacteria bacterium]|nr:hypothetical protein [Candidatus Portnoybacteria bacterium]MDD4982378.1 hypothetical protein [Candidatus Portnoybacteria bacterium]